MIRASSWSTDGAQPKGRPLRSVAPRPSWPLPDTNGWQRAHLTSTFRASPSLNPIDISQCLPDLLRPRRAHLSRTRLGQP
jgi:hypothetical protein